MQFALPKTNRIAKSADFRSVYDEGKRFDGRFMTLFLRPNKLGFQRLGVTASKKIIGKAHDRNRAKRLVRETFRLSKIELDTVSHNYDWVINCKRNLLNVKLDQPLCDFRQLIEAVKKNELIEGETDAK